MEINEETWRGMETYQDTERNQEKTLKIVFRKFRVTDRPSDPLIEMRGRI